jgi:hypothetical protein
MTKRKPVKRKRKHYFRPAHQTQAVIERRRYRKAAAQ